MLYKLVANHPIASAAGFEDYDGKTFDVDAPLSWDEWCKVAERRLGFKVDRRPGTSRMIDGIPCFFPRPTRTGVHCVKIVRVEGGE
jgi:hypothetical protein